MTNLRIQIAAGLIAACSCLAGCAGQTPTIIDNSTVSQAQAVVNATCGVIADAAPLAELIARFYSQGAVVNAAAQAALEFCSVLATSKGAGLRARSGTITVRGIPVHWRRAR